MRRRLGIGGRREFRLKLEREREEQTKSGEATEASHGQLRLPIQPSTHSVKSSHVASGSEQH